MTSALDTFRSQLSRRPNLGGCVFALVFWWRSLTPSMLPRGWMAQAVIGAASALVGYGLGTFVGWLVHLALGRLDRRPSRRVREIVLVGVRPAGRGHRGVGRDHLASLATRSAAAARMGRPQPPAGHPDAPADDRARARRAAALTGGVVGHPIDRFGDRRRRAASGRARGHDRRRDRRDDPPRHDPLPRPLRLVGQLGVEGHRGRRRRGRRAATEPVRLGQPGIAGDLGAARSGRARLRRRVDDRGRAARLLRPAGRGCPADPDLRGSAVCDRRSGSRRARRSRDGSHRRVRSQGARRGDTDRDGAGRPGRGASDRAALPRRHGDRGHPVLGGAELDVERRRP